MTFYSLGQSHLRKHSHCLIFYHTKLIVTCFMRVTVFKVQTHLFVHHRCSFKFLVTYSYGVLLLCVFATDSYRRPQQQSFVSVSDQFAVSLPSVSFLPQRNHPLMTVIMSLLLTIKSLQATFQIDEVLFCASDSFPFSRFSHFLALNLETHLWHDATLIVLRVTVVYVLADFNNALVFDGA